MQLQAGATRRQALGLPPCELLYFERPRFLERADSRIDWPAEHRMGPISRLDLSIPGCVNALFDDARPKLVLVLVEELLDASAPS